MNDSEMIRAAAEAEATEKQAIQPMTAPMAAGGAPMAMDPAMMGGMPPVPPVGGPGGGGAPAMPPLDPAMMGAPPPGGEGGAPPLDPSMLGLPPGGPPPGEGEPPPEEPINVPETDVNNDQKPDTMVPLEGIKDFTVGIIEATKGKKTQEAPLAEAAGAGGAGAPMDIAGAIGGAPAAEPMGAMPNLGAPPPKLSDVQKQMEEDLG